MFVIQLPILLLQGQLPPLREAVVERETVESFSTTGNPSLSSSNTSHVLGQIDIASKMPLMLLPAPHVRDRAHFNQRWDT